MAYLGKKKKQNQTKKRMLSQRSTIYNMKREECLKKKQGDPYVTLSIEFTWRPLWSQDSRRTRILRGCTKQLCGFRPFRVGNANTSNTCA